MSERNGIDYKAKCLEYERRMGIGDEDPAKDGYLVLVKILKAQNNYLDNFKLKDLISSDDAAKKIEYTNAKNLWEKLPDMIRNVAALKMELKMEGEEKKTTFIPISAKEIANGNV
jgi:hypothetical protein